MIKPKDLQNYQLTQERVLKAEKTEFLGGAHFDILIVVVPEVCVCKKMLASPGLWGRRGN